jgi:hypothetical protein
MSNEVVGMGELIARDEIGWAKVVTGRNETTTDDECVGFVCVAKVFSWSWLAWSCELPVPVIQAMVKALAITLPSGVDFIWGFRVGFDGLLDAYTRTNVTTGWTRVITAV